MTTQEIHKIVLETFQKERENHSAPFKTSIAFLRTLELRFSICFKTSDYDRHYTIDQLVEKIKARIENPDGNKMIIRERVADRKIHLFGIITLIFIPTVAYFKIHVVSLVVTISFGVAMWWLMRSHRQYIRHNSLLFKKLIGNNHSTQ